MITSITESGSATRAITKHDTYELPQVNGRWPRALYIGGTGDVALKYADGTSDTLEAVPVGILQIAPRFVLSTGTTATNIHAIN